MEFHPSQRPATGRRGRQSKAGTRLRVPRAAAAPVLTLLSLLASAGAQPGQAAKYVSVKDVRYWSLGDVTRIAVETTGEFRFKYNRLSNPPRIYFDILNARQRISRETVHTIPVGDDLIKRIRVSQNRRTVARVVLDLETEVEVSASQLVNPNRLIIEVRRKGRKRSLEEKLTLASPGAPSRKQARRKEQPAPAGKKESAARIASAGKSPVKVIEKPLAAPPMKRTASKTAAGGKAKTVQASVANAGRRGTPEKVKKAQAQAAAKPVRQAKLTVSRPPVPATRSRSNSSGPIAASKTPGTKSSAPRQERAATSPRPEQREPESSGEESEFLIATPARRNSTGGHSLTRVLGLKLGRIVIDPGHGGRDTGTIGPTGLREKDVTLDVSKRLARLLEERLGAEVVLTRNSDQSLSLERRTEIANKALADLFVSVHVNSSRYRTVNGAETFYLNLTRSRADLEVAARENAGSNRSIHELTSLIQKIALDDKLQESRDLAANVQTAVYKMHRKLNPRARNRGVKKAPFVVLIGAKMPSILVEVGFISNPREEKLLKTEKYRQQLAEALYDGIAAYANSLSHFQVARSTGPTSEE